MPAYTAATAFLAVFAAAFTALAAHIHDWPLTALAAAITAGLAHDLITDLRQLRRTRHARRTEE